MYILKSTEIDNCYVALMDFYGYCLTYGEENAHQFTQTQLNIYLATLPENNGLETLEV